MPDRSMSGRAACCLAMQPSKQLKACWPGAAAQQARAGCILCEATVTRSLLAVHAPALTQPAGTTKPLRNHPAHPLPAHCT